jgi:hypothetical protein
MWIAKKGLARFSYGIYSLPEVLGWKSGVQYAWESHLIPVDVCQLEEIGMKLLGFSLIVFSLPVYAGIMTYSGTVNGVFSDPVLVSTPATGSENTPLTVPE